MGTGGKNSHQSYTVEPTITLAGPTPADTLTADKATELLEGILEAIDTKLGDPPAAVEPADVLEQPVPEPAAEATGTPPASGDPAGDELTDPAGVEQAGPEPPGEPAPPEPARDADDVDPRDKPVLPVPEQVPVGVATGVPALVGGADLVDAAVTLVAYDSPDGPREVLLATVDEQAEAKLLDALALGKQEMVPQQVQEKVTGRLPMDKEQQLHEQLALAAKKVNGALKKGGPIPEPVLGLVNSAETAVAAVEANPDATDDEKAMAAYYRAHLDAIGARVDGTVTAAYAEGGKVPHVDPYLHTGMATVTKMVAVTVSSTDGLPTVSGPASRIGAVIDPVTGASSWDGTSRSSASGTQYDIDLGDGYQAIYRPYGANEKKNADYSLRGKLEVIAPPGGGNAPELVKRLGQLHLVNRPMTASEGEWSYLQANITAQGLGTHPAVSGALADSAQLQNLVLQELFYSHAHQAVGKSETELAIMARDLQLEAAARVLPKKVTAVRDAVAAATGHGSGAALAASAGYDPTPIRSGGWLTWSRFDVAANPQHLQQAWKNKKLVHHLGGGGLAPMLSTGVLASTERRAAMGTAQGLGKSEDADKKSGGANAVFLRVNSSAPSSGPALVWDDPQVLMRRTDYYGYDGDHYGAINPKNHHYSTSVTRDPAKIAKFGASNNEIMFRDGIDLLGAEAPSRIVCSSQKERASILKLLTAKGVTHLRGRPIDQVVT
ncbi:hypothetical protein [Actinoplanes sp. G11-F43]|uniref:hypothetical protein n=1 Tax=Actinoplanes sp. G11-F43 TaxID=3424130 RepID=UPI003D336639